MKKLAIATLIGSVFSLGSISAMADSGNPFPRTYGPVDHTVPAGTSDSKNPFPKQIGPVDRSIDVVAMTDTSSPFP